MSINAAAKSLQSYPTLCNPIDGSPPGSPVPVILQARTLEWVAISFSNAWKWKVKVKSLSRVRLLVTPWTAAHQAPASMGFSRQEYRSGVPLPPPYLLKRILSVYHFMANRWGNKANSERLFSWAPKSLQMVTAAIKLRHLLFGRKAMTIDSVLKKQRHHFANKDPYSRSCTFSGSHIRMWE